MKSSLCTFSALLLTACSATPLREDEVARTSSSPEAPTSPSAAAPRKVAKSETQMSEEPHGGARGGPDAPARAATPPGQGASSRMRKCLLIVEGAVHVDGPCAVFPMGRHQYTMNAWSGGKPRNAHFAVVSVDDEGVATATWNADPADDRALNPLGAVQREGDCWVNERTRICVR